MESQEPRGYKTTTTQEKSELKGYQAVANREKRMAGEFEEPKSASKKSKAPNMCIFVVWILINSNPDLILEFLNNEFASAN